MSYLPPDFTVVLDKNASESEDVAAAEKASRFLSEDVSCSAVLTFFLKNICSFADVSSSSISLVMAIQIRSLLPSGRALVIFYFRGLSPKNRHKKEQAKYGRNAKICLTT